MRYMPLLYEHFTALSQNYVEKCHSPLEASNTPFINFYNLLDATSA